MSAALNGPALHVQGELLPVLAHPQRELRHTAGSVATAIVGALGLAHWPELVLAMGASMDGDQLPPLDGALDTLFKVMEDHPHMVRGRPR